MPLLVFQLVISKVGERVPFLIRPLANKITDGIRAGFVQPRLKIILLFWSSIWASMSMSRVNSVLPISR